ncbi:glycosyltransferase family 2 protein [uncultured Ilyobacter sp.]|uniref:glycosyltransferase n=1 Tax=uncultured Ilyobacter sp. TaxID=544433 RepID=UPI0029F48526|nr:glycosyltransferase family 2 protein [uncultured Ilyobacter sp.]
MSVWWIAIGFYGVVVAGWWVRHVLLSLARPLGLYVAPASGAARDGCLSVVIPARNESERLAECVRTVLSQGPVVRELIVVDDRSDDDTAAVASAAAEGDQRLRVVRIDALPAGWAGKAHACQRGGELASSPWVLFADADCRFDPGGLAGAVEHAEQHNADLLTLWIAADHRSFWEHMLIPLCGALILYWFPPFRANQASSSLAYANGQFVLGRRERYLAMGGHDCARDTVIEDIPLAQHAKRFGLRLRTALGPEIVAVRMYTNFRETYNGWTRIFIGALQRRWKLLASMVSLAGGSLLPSVGAPLAALHVVRHGWPDDRLTLVFIVLLWLHFVAVYSVSYRAWGLCRCDRRYLWLYPVSVVVVGAILLRSWWWMLTRRPIVWRGTRTGSQA